MDYKQIMMAAQVAMQALLNKAKSETRVFTDEEKTSFDAEQKRFRDAQAMLNAEASALEIENAIKQPVNEPNHTVVVVKNDNAKLWPGGFGEQLVAVKNHCLGKASADETERLFKNAASGMNSTVPSEGGILLEREATKEILRKTFEKAVVASRCEKRPVGAAFNGQSWYELDESSRVAGSRHGGVQSYWAAEASTVTATKPKLLKKNLDLGKIMTFVYATDELLMDTTGLEAEVSALVSDEFAWKLDDAIYATGSGAGIPLAILSSPAFVSIAKEAGQSAATIVYENILKMWMRLWAPSRGNSVWFINQNCEKELATMAMVVGTGGVPVYMPAGGLSTSPYGTLMGRPVIPIEQAKTVGTVGDIVLADMSQYRMIQKGEMQQDSSIHVRFLYDENCYRFMLRINGMPKWNKALTPANGADTLSPFVGLATRA